MCIPLRTHIWIVYFHCHLSWLTLQDGLRVDSISVCESTRGPSCVGGCLQLCSTFSGWCFLAGRYAAPTTPATRVRVTQSTGKHKIQQVVMPHILIIMIYNDRYIMISHDIYCNDIYMIYNNRKPMIYN